MSDRFWSGTLYRALRTFAQALLGYLGAASILSEVNWATAFSASVLACLVSVLTSVVLGIPEAPND